VAVAQDTCLLRQSMGIIATLCEGGLTFDNTQSKRHEQTIFCTLLAFFGNQFSSLVCHHLKVFTDGRRLPYNVLLQSERGKCNYLNVTQSKFSDPAP